MITKINGDILLAEYQSQERTGPFKVNTFDKYFPFPILFIATIMIRKRMQSYKKKKPMSTATLIYPRYLNHLISRLKSAHFSKTILTSIHALLYFGQGNKPRDRAPVNSPSSEQTRGPNYSSAATMEPITDV